MAYGEGGDDFRKNTNHFLLQFFITKILNHFLLQLIFSCYYCSLELKSLSEQSRLRPRTSSLVSLCILFCMVSNLGV